MSTPSADSDRVLAGSVVAVPEARQLDVLASLLERRGASVLRCPLVGINDAPDRSRSSPGSSASSSCRPTSSCSTPAKASSGCSPLRAARGSRREFVGALARTPKLTRGPKPKRALRQARADTRARGDRADDRGPRRNRRGDHQAPASASRFSSTAKIRTGGSSSISSTAACRPDCVAPYVYASAADDDRVVDLIDQLAAGRVTAIAFTSKAQVQRLLKLARQRQLEPALRSGLDKTRVAAIGPVVADELTAAGIRVDTMPDGQLFDETARHELVRAARRED